MKHNPAWITNYGFGLYDQVEFWAVSSSPFKFRPELRKGTIVHINSKTVVIRTKHTQFRLDNVYEPKYFKMIKAYEGDRPEPNFLSKVK